MGPLKGSAIVENGQKKTENSHILPNIQLRKFGIMKKYVIDFVDATDLICCSIEMQYSQTFLIRTSFINIFSIRTENLGNKLSFDISQKKNYSLARVSYSSLDKKNGVMEVK